MNYNDDYSGNNISDSVMRIVIAEAAKKAVGFVGKKAILIICISIIVILCLIGIFTMFASPSVSMKDGGDGVYEDLGYDIEDEAAYGEWFYDPQNVLEHINEISEEIDPNIEGFGHMYLDEANMKELLNKVIEYRQKVLRDAMNPYKYLLHSYKKENVPYQDEDGWHDDWRTVYDIYDKEHISYISNHSAEDDPVFVVSWQEIYCFAAMKSIMEGTEGKWDDRTDVSTGTPKLFTEARLEPAVLDDIIEHFTYNFVYNFDPTDPSYAGHTFTYDEMESYAYILVDEGQELAEHGTEDPAVTDNFEYRQMKRPAVAPAYGVNCYQLVEYAYDSSGTLNGRTITVDGQAFYDYAVTVIGKDFSMDWLLYLIKNVPGSEYDAGNGSLITKYEKIEESYRTGTPISYFDDNFYGVDLVTLGGGCTQQIYNSANNNDMFADSSVGNRTGSAYEGILTGNALVDYAQQFIGNPYVWGGTSLTNGADCSGFVQQIYAHFGITLPRTSAEQAQAGGMTRIPIREAQAGDLLFRTVNGQPSGVKHVAIVIGVEGDKIITVEAMDTAHGICIGTRSVSRSSLFVMRITG